MEAAYGELRDALVADLRERIAAMSPADFEDLVLDVLHAMGYGEEGEGSRLRTSDGGIDGVIRQDRLGLDVVYVQAKRWEATVGRPASGIRRGIAGCARDEGDHLHRLRLLTGRARYAATVSPRVVLVDGERLAELMIDHDVGVSARETYAVKRVDSDYFGDEVVV